MATLYVGLGIGMFRLILDTITTFKGTQFEGFLGQIAAIPFSHFAILIFVICVGVILVVSLLTEKPSETQLAGLTFGTLSAEQKANTKNSYGLPDIVASVFIIGVIIAILTYFTG
jgi:SSS family solute:Na+ symporter